MEASKAGGMPLKDEDIVFMEQLDMRVWAARQTLQVALQTHSATMRTISEERGTFWEQLRGRFGLTKDTDFCIAKIDGFWQIQIMDAVPSACMMEAAHV